jgi:flagellar biosynthesis protein FlhG
MDVGFISGGSGITGMSNLSRENLSYIIQNLAELDAMADTIIVDTGAGISDSVLEFLIASGEILLITTPEPTSITDSYSLIKALRRHPRFSSETSQIKVIANKVTDEREAEALYRKLEAVVARYLHLPISYLGMIPQDTQLARAVMQQTPVSLNNPRARSAMAYEVIAAKLMNKELNQHLTKRGMASFFSHIVSRR